MLKGEFVVEAVLKLKELFGVVDAGAAESPNENDCDVFEPKLMPV